MPGNRSALRAALLGCVAALLVCFSGLPDAQALTVDIAPPPAAPVGQPVEFVAMAQDADGDVTFDWNFGDGTELTMQPATVTHQYSAPGHYPVIVKAIDQSSFRSKGFMLTVHRPLPATPPSSSSPLALDAARRRVWCVNPDSDTLSAFDVSTREKLFEVPTDLHPRTVARASDDTFWVVNQDSHSLTIHEASGGARIGSVVLDYASRPFGIVIHGTAAYVSLEGLGSLVRVDTTTREITGRVSLGPFPRGLSVSADGAELFVARFISPESGGEIYRVNAGEMRLSATLTLAIDQHMDGESNGRGLPNYLAVAALSPDGQSLFIPSKKDNMERGAGRDGLPLTHDSSVRPILSRIDLGLAQEDAAFRVDFNDRDSPSAVAFTSFGDTAFVSMQGSNRLEIVDAYSGAIIGGILDAGLAPLGLVVFENVLVVHGFMSRELAFFDVSTVLDGTDYSGTLLGRTSAVATEKLSPEVLLGKRIFYDAADTRMSRDGYLSCASCHIDGFEDGRVWDFTDRGEGFRNTTSLLGRRGTGHGPVHWTANFDEIQDFEHDIRNAFGGTGYLTDAEFAEGTRNMTLGDPKAGISADLDALAAYVTSLDRVHPSPFRNPNGTLTSAGVRGRELFEELDCGRCHAGEDFTDSASGIRHDVGTAGPKSGQRLGGPLDGFDTPTLLGIWETAPYLHDGSARTLAEVLTRAGAEIHLGRALTVEEVDGLVAYLQQVDGLPDIGSEPTGGLGGMAGMAGSAQTAGSGGVAGIAGAAGGGGIAGSSEPAGAAGTAGVVEAPTMAQRAGPSSSGCSLPRGGSDGLALASASLLLALLRRRRRGHATGGQRTPRATRPDVPML